MARARFTSLAELDLNEIWLFVAGQSVDSADRLQDRVLAICQSLAEQPGMGEARPDLKDGLRVFPVGNYIIFYRPEPDGIEVVRVLHGARDYARLFS